jgi:DNA replication protein DnaC
VRLRNASLSFIERPQNIVFIGQPGTGKTGLAIGLLRQALMNGCRGRLHYAQDLMDELYASLADRSTPKLVRRICNYPVLLIDEQGYLTLKPEQINAFFILMGES